MMKEVYFAAGGSREAGHGLVEAIEIGVPRRAFFSCSSAPLPPCKIAFVQTMPVTFKRRQYWLKRHWRQTLIALALIASGFAAGWSLARARSERTRVLVSDPAVEQWSLPALSASQQQSLDDAFAALKSGRYDAAEQKFTDLLRQQRLWTSLNSDLACLALYQRDEEKLRTLSRQGEKDGSLSAADGKLLQALRLVKPGTFKAADVLFGEAAAGDPTRADLFDQWGDCLLRWGKPAAAAGKYHAALLRNPFPVMDDLYRAKLLLARIQAGEDTPEGNLGPRLDRALAAPEPSSAALFAGAARAVRAGRYADAAALLERARRVSAPGMFRELLFNPCFVPDAVRPELKPFYNAAEQARADALDLQGDE